MTKEDKVVFEATLLVDEDLRMMVDGYMLLERKKGNADTWLEQEKTKLEKLKKVPMQVVVYSDSKYVVDAVEKKWVFRWEKTNFKDKKNSDLWKRFLKVYKKHDVQFQWIKGHNMHPQNERCDQLAVNAAKGKELIADTVFQQSEQSDSK